MEGIDINNTNNAERSAAPTVTAMEWADINNAERSAAPTVAVMERADINNTSVNLQVHWGDGTNNAETWMSAAPTVTLLTEQVDINNTSNNLGLQVCQGDDTNNAKTWMSAAPTVTATECVDINNTSNNLQVHRSDDMKDTEMSAAPQPLTTATKETPAPFWLSRMLVYLRGVSDNVEWQNLVLALLKFENLKPPPGVGPPLL